MGRGIKWPKIKAPKIKAPKINLNKDFKRLTGLDVSKALQQATRVGSFDDVAQTIERNLQNAGAGASALLSGNWNNAARSFADIAQLSALGPSGTFLNIDSAKDQVQETNIARFQKQAEKEAERNAAAEVQAAREAELGAVRSTIKQNVDQRKLAPGRRLSLLSRSRATNNLLGA